MGVKYQNTALKKPHCKKPAYIALNIQLTVGPKTVIQDGMINILGYE
jgi:hypothetical protein